MAGEFRLPKHGLEYRTLSNFWLMDPALFYVTFELARVVMRATSYGLLDFWHADQQVVIDTINNYDVDMARRLLRRNEKLFVKLFSAANSTWSQPFMRHDGSIIECTPELVARRALQLGLEGMESAMRTPDVLKNWETNRTWKQHVLTTA